MGSANSLSICTADPQEASEADREVCKVREILVHARAWEHNSATQGEGRSRPLAKMFSATETIYGLYLLELAANNYLLREFRQALNDLGAPSWPEIVNPDPVTRRLEAWLIQIAETPFPNGQWWAVMEKYALLALASDPGMDLRIPRSRTDLGQLAVLRCGAAKRAVHGLDLDNNPTIADVKKTKQWKMVDAILEGNSLTLHTAGIDPINSIMAAAVNLKRKFGDQIKHYVFKAPQLAADFVVAAQTLTEELTQSVLSVKTLDAQLPDFKEYEKTFASQLINGRAGGEEGGKSVSSEIDRAAVAKIEDEVGDNRVARELTRGFLSENGKKFKLPIWLEWLHSPYDLCEILSRPNVQELKLPLSDLRVQPFVSRILSDI
jgi:hypothetical protein